MSAYLLRSSGRGQASSSLQELATQSADITADDTAAEAGMGDGFGTFDDFDDGVAGMSA